MKEPVSPTKYAERPLGTWQEQTAVAQTISLAAAAIQEGDESGRLYHVPLAPEGQFSTAPIPTAGRPA